MAALKGKWLKINLNPTLDFLILQIFWFYFSRRSLKFIPINRVKIIAMIKKMKGVHVTFQPPCAYTDWNTTLSEKIQRNTRYTQIETLRCHNTLKYSIAQLLVDS